MEETNMTVLVLLARHLTEGTGQAAMSLEEAGL
jgi:hypothetical protein